MGWETNVVGDFPGRVQLPSGTSSWRLPGWHAAISFLRTHVANSLYLTPIFVARATTYDRVAIDVSNAAAGGSVMRLGLYDANPATLLPDALLNDFGTVAVDSTGDKIITTTFTLQRGYYWTAHISDGAPQLLTIDNGATSTLPMEGFSIIAAVDLPGNILLRVVSQPGVATGGLPDPAPVTDNSNSTTFAAVKFRTTP